MENMVKISLQDQIKINNFSKMHTKNKEFGQTSLNYKNDINLLEDCKDDLMELEDDENVHVLFSNCFFNLKVSDANEILEDRQTNIKKDLDKLEKEKKELEVNLQLIKSDLKTKFGNNIYLEEK